MVDVTVLGISLQDDGASPVLLLHPTGTRRILSVAIGPMEAVAVSTALHGALPYAPESPGEAGDESGQGAGKETGESVWQAAGRGGASLPFGHTPQAHEFLLNTVIALGAEFSAVELVGFSDGEFSARAVFANNGANIRVACRPADGVVLALRSGAPVRCAEALLAYAESIDAVMAGLPEHVRTLAAAKLGEQGTRDVPEWLRVPLAVEEALAARARNGAVSAHDELVSVARKMLEEDDERRRSGTAADRKGPRIILEPKTIVITPEKAKASGAQPSDPSGPSGAHPSVRAPQIRVTMVRHTGKGQTEVIDEFEVPAGGIPRDVLASLGLNGKEARTVNGASEEERWATLLRLLDPETKVPM